MASHRHLSALQGRAVNAATVRGNSHIGSVDTARHKKLKKTLMLNIIKSSQDTSYEYESTWSFFGNRQGTGLQR